MNPVIETAKKIYADKLKNTSETVANTQLKKLVPTLISEADYQSITGQEYSA